MAAQCAVSLAKTRYMDIHILKAGPLRTEHALLADSVEKVDFWESCLSVAQKTLSFGAST